MYKTINSFFSYLNNKRSLFVLTPNRTSFGNSSEELLFGLMRVQHLEKKLLLVYPKLKIAGKSLSIVNKEIYHLESSLISINSNFKIFIYGSFLTIYILLLRVIDFIRKLVFVRKCIRILFYKIEVNPTRIDGFVVPQIGRGDIWQPFNTKSFSWDVVKNENWAKQYANYVPPNISSERLKELHKVRIEMGIPINDWFVCIHVSEAIHPNPPTVRHASIENYIEGIKSIVNAGGWVVRLGTPDMKKLPQMDKVVDYGHLKYKNELMDLYLINQCKFFVGLASGPTFVAALFDKPQILVNMTDWSMGIPLKKGNLMITKHVFSKSRNRFLSVREITEEPYDITVFEKPSDEYTLYENSPNEIKDVIEEFLNHENSFEYSQLQKEFNFARKKAIKKWIDGGAPQWSGVPLNQNMFSQYRIASRIDAGGTMGNKYLTDNWAEDPFSKLKSFS